MEVQGMRREAITKARESKQIKSIDIYLPKKIQNIQRND